MSLYSNINIEANRVQRGVLDKAALHARTMTFTEQAEDYNLQFIPEGDKRLNDKLNYNFREVVTKFKEINTDTNVFNNDFCLVDTTTQAVSLTLPSTHLTKVTVFDVKNNFDNETCTLTSASTINGNATMDLTTAGSRTELLNVNGNWILI